ncbi:hypothetical protein B296_00035072 [Ensete ventricosum]|uniref:Thaumatin-like protein n=1 Tax=Ensete ventricosum TaxID=4639 RepID=A0A426ZDI8_ENSVE|nr:hypothetical protein B296_00035072 [Ensete ventricosum]
MQKNQQLHGGCNATGCLADLNRGKTPCLFPLSFLQSKPVSDHHIRITKAPLIYVHSFLCSGCPKELRVDGGGGVVACKSACEAFGLDEYCCSGEYANPTSCKPSFYSTIFKAACPRAYSYAFDDGTSTFTGKAYDYTIVFCANVNKVISYPSKTCVSWTLESLSR